MMKKRVLGLLLSLSLIVTLLPTFAGAVSVRSFTDVKQSDWFYADVDFVTARNYFVGTTNTTFSPQRTMTRAMFVVVLARMEKVTVDNKSTSFSDVPAGSWCSGAVDWAAKNGIVTGYGDGTFNPNGEITRQQMCAIMARYIDYCAKHGKNFRKQAKVSGFGDEADIAATFKSAVQTCISYGIIYGYKDGNFYPTWNSTRAHVAAVIHRLALLVQAASGGGGGGGGGGGSTTNTTTMTTTNDLLWDNGVAPASEAMKADLESAKSSSGILANFGSYELNYSKENEEVILQLDGKLNSAFLKVLVASAVNYAINAVDTLGPRAGAEDSYDKAVETVKAVLDSMGLQYDELTVKEIAESVYDKTVETGKGAMKDTWTALTAAKFETVAIQQDGTTIVAFDHDGNIVEGSATSKTEAAKELAKAVTKVLIENLHTNTSETSVLNLTTEDHFQAVFTGAETETVTTTTTTRDGEVIDEKVESKVDYDAAATNTYALILQVNLDGEGILAYYYDSEDNLVVIVTQEIKDGYNKVAQKAVVEAAKYAAGVGGSSSASGEAETNKAALMEGEVDYAKAERIIPGITKLADEVKSGSVTSAKMGVTLTFQVDDIDAKVNNIITTLIDENAEYLSGQSDTVVTTKTAELVFQLLEEIIKSMIANQEEGDIRSIANSLNGTGSDALDAQAEVHDKIANLLDAIDTDGAVTDAMCDYLANAFGDANGDAECTEALEGSANTLKSAIEASIATAFEDKASNIGGTAGDLLNKARTVGSYDNAIAYLEGKDAATLGTKVQGYAAAHAAAFDRQGDLTALIAKVLKVLPNGNPTITIEDITITGSDFDGIKNASSNSEAIAEAGKLLAKFGSLTIDDFANGVKVTVAGSVKNHSASATFNLIVRY